MAKKYVRHRRCVDARVAASPLELLQSLLDRIDCDASFVVRYKIATGDYRGAAEYRADPRDYDSPDGYALASAVCGLVSKFPDFPGSETKSADALSKFLECEEICRLTNERFRDRVSLYRDFPEPLKPVLWRAKEKIRRLLGAFSWDKVSEAMTWGPGSTTSLPRARAHGAYKFGHKPDCTIDNLVPAHALISSDLNWWNEAAGRAAINSPLDIVNIVEGSRITTVPKDSFIDRVIAIEPDMNMFVQKGFGGYIRKRLKQRRVDLDSQEMNQVYACVGSKTGEFATLDLSSASDLISFEVVKFLLPYDWFEAMLYPRSSSAVLPSGEVIPLQKFSSMGNGYTFELESMIFWALSECVVELSDGYRDVAIFGDDIIVPTRCYGDLVTVLHQFGFIVNMKKSFCEGAFRESCGKHYFQGIEVTPPRWTKTVRLMSDVLRLANKLTRFAIRLGHGIFRDSRLRSAIAYLKSLLSPVIRGLMIPDGFGDGGLVSSFDEARPAKAKHGLEGYTVKALISSTRHRTMEGVGCLLWSLHTLHRSREVSTTAPSDSPMNGEFGIRPQLVPKWDFIGPWVDVL